PRELVGRDRRDARDAVARERADRATPEDQRELRRATTDIGSDVERVGRRVGIELGVVAGAFGRHVVEASLRGNLTDATAPATAIPASAEKDSSSGVECAHPSAAPALTTAPDAPVPSATPSVSLSWRDAVRLPS